MPPPKDPIKYMEWLRKNKESHMGKEAWNKGVPMSEEQKEKLRIKSTGVIQSQDTKDKRSVSLKGRFTGEEHPRYGKKDSQETIERKRLGALNRKPSPMRNENISKSLKGRKITWGDKIRNNLRGRFKGEESPFYKGGKALEDRIRRLWQMEDWRKRVFERDGYRDVITGLRSNNLNAHHIIPFKDLLIIYNIKSEQEAIDCPALWDIDNGMTLDRDNHMALFHSGSTDK